MLHVRAWLPTLFVATSIFILSAQPTFGITLEGWRSEVLSNVVHFVEFAALAAAIAYGLKAEGMELEDAGKIAILMAFLFGVTDEIHQRFVPGRSSSPLDLIPDLIGAWAGVRLYRAAVIRGRRVKTKGDPAAPGPPFGAP